MGIFGAGNSGAAVNKFVAPALVVGFGWTMVPHVYAAVMLGTVILFWVFSRHDASHVVQGQTRFMDQLRALRDPGVLKYSQYYSIVFGGYVALSLWMNWIALFLLSYQQTQFTVLTTSGPSTFHLGLNVYTFTALMFILAFAFAFGKASVFKYIADDYPANIGTVSGIVGLAGGMGGFLLPILFGALLDLTGIRSSAFMLMYGVVSVSLAWMFSTEVRRTDGFKPVRRQAAKLLLVHGADFRRPALGRHHHRVPAATSHGHLAVLITAGVYGVLGGVLQTALYGFIVFYVICVLVTWWIYSRKNRSIPCCPPEIQGAHNESLS
jgi:NNP family nitrate/nitrite transporter-like MFS transporter